MVATRGQGRPPIDALSQRNQLLVAALIWAIGGGALTISGTLRLSRTDSNLLIPLLIGAAVAGFIKARFALLPFVRRATARIRGRRGGGSLIGLFAPKTWLLIILMIALGRILNLLAIPQEIRGAVQLAIGLGLLVTSVPFWGAWRAVSRP